MENYQKLEEEEENHTILNIEVKDGVTISNILAIGLVFCASGLATFFFNASVVYLLRDPLYFDITSSAQLNQVNSDVIFYSLLVSMCMSPFLGQLWDIVGRKAVILVNVAILALVMVGTPFTSPHFWLLTTMRMFMTVS